MRRLKIKLKPWLVHTPQRAKKMRSPYNFKKLRKSLDAGLQQKTSRVTLMLLTSSVRWWRLKEASRLTESLLWINQIWISAICYPRLLKKKLRRRRSSPLFKMAVSRDNKSLIWIVMMSQNSLTNRMSNLALVTTQMSNKKFHALTLSIKNQNWRQRRVYNSLSSSKLKHKKRSR